MIKVRPFGIEIASPRRVEDIVGTQKAAISLARIGRDPNEEETWSNWFDGAKHEKDSSRFLNAI